MKISASDMRCRYIAAPGTQTAPLSPFGEYLKSFGVIVPGDCSLDYMVRSGWIQPVLRVALSRPAFESWVNYPELSMQGTDNCPEGDEWSLGLWIKSLTSPMPPIGNTPKWGMHLLDDDSIPLTQAARGHAIEPRNNEALPAPFKHPRSGVEIKPWLDFFAYWQAYQLAELLAAATGKFYVTPDFEKRLGVGSAGQLEFVEANAQRIKKRWDKRRSTFEWLSRFRTILASGIYHNWEDVKMAAKQSADEQRLSCRRVAAKMRNTLLVIWKEWDRNPNVVPGYEKLRRLLRQDIEYALCLWEMLSGQKADFLAPCWTYPDRNSRRWAQLIEALPKDGELARKQFSHSAIMYLGEHANATPGRFPIDVKCIDALLSKSWNTSRALRRFCLAFFRLHQELDARGGSSGETVIRSNELIEQLLITILNAERLVIAIHRKNNPTPNGRYQETPKVVKNQLNLVLGKFKLAKNGIGAKAMTETKRLLKEKGGLEALRLGYGGRPGLIQIIWSFLQSMRPSVFLVKRRAQKNAGILIDTKSELHDLDTRGSQIFVKTTEINSGSKEADYFAAACVNFLIARNYAAHHDSRDEAFVVPNGLGVSEHFGNVALKSTLTVVLTGLQTLR